MKTDDRRSFLFCLLSALGAAGIDRPARCAAGRVNAVRGPLRPGALGLTLVHEHVLVDFIGADRVRRDRYQADEALQAVLPHLKIIQEFGCRTIAECTPAYLGRDPVLLKRLSEASGLHLVTNTGYYGAAGGKFLPEHARKESAGHLAKRWIDEFQNGIEGSGIKPGFIKIGVNNGPLSDMDAKLARAAALTHRATGMTIASHTGDGAAALQQLQILGQENVAPAAFIWVHAGKETNFEVHFKAARQGAWVEFEATSEASLGSCAKQVKAMLDRGFLRQVLLSLDAGWYHVGEPGGGTFRGYEFFFTRFVPTLRQEGVTEAQMRTLTVENPQRALELRVRTR
jgi:phosphotriesterase-related protein